MTQSVRKRNDSEEWFKKTFASDYLWLYAHRSDREGRKQVKMAMNFVPFSKGQKILDIACGAGRHMLAFAKHGAHVTGIDLSTSLLKTARNKFAQAGLPAVLRHCDMRKLSYHHRFDGVTMWFTSFGYFPRKSDDMLVLTRLAEALKTGGWWWIDLPNPASLVKHLVKQSSRIANGPHGRAKIIERRKIVGNRVQKTIRIIDSAGERTIKEDVRLYRPEQFGAMIKKAKLQAQGVLGDYDGVALTADSPRQIWFGIKP